MIVPMVSSVLRSAVTTCHRPVKAFAVKARRKSARCEPPIPASPVLSADAG
jgi:hypothetical protein